MRLRSQGKSRLWTSREDILTEARFFNLSTFVDGDACRVINTHGENIGLAYDLAFYELHAPAEHLINDKRHHAELQLFFQANDGDDLLAIAVFLDATTDVPHRWMDELLFNLKFGAGMYFQTLT